MVTFGRSRNHDRGVADHVESRKVLASVGVNGPLVPAWDRSVPVDGARKGHARNTSRPCRRWRWTPTASGSVSASSTGYHSSVCVGAAPKRSDESKPVGVARIGRVSEHFSWPPVETTQIVRCLDVSTGPISPAVAWVLARGVDLWGFTMSTAVEIDPFSAGGVDSIRVSIHVPPTHDTGSRAERKSGGAVELGGRWGREFRGRVVSERERAGEWLWSWTHGM